jgi:RNA polymerase sigma-70 factor (ECF subfamily)
MKQELMVSTSSLPDQSMAFATAIATCDGQESGQLERPSFATLIARHGDEIYRYAWQLTRNQADADDLYQETLLKAFRAVGKLDGNANYRAWLYRITSNTFISDRRKRAREHPLTDAIEQSTPATPKDHDGQLDARELLGEVQDFVETLPPKQRMALVLRKYHDMSYTEIAETLHSSEPAARANVHQALRKLRDTFAHRLEA